VSFEQPLGLALLGLAVPILVLHALRPRARRSPISALFLWRDLNTELTARRRWRLPPLSILLLLQLLALAAVALGLAGPRLGTTSRRSLAIVLDSSASMQATDVAPSRFEAARAQATTLLNELAESDRSSLVVLRDPPVALASSAAPREARAALEGLRPGIASGSLRDGLVLADRLARGDASVQGEIVVFTDGTVSRDNWPDWLKSSIQFRLLGTRARNQGVSTLEVRPGSGGAMAGFAQITNYDDRPVEAPVRLRADGALLETRSVRIDPRGRAGLSFDLPPRTRLVSVEMAGGDDLALDDRAVTPLPAPRPRRAQIVSVRPELWQRALGAVPGFSAETTAPERYAGAPGDLTVFDGYLPDALPSGPSLLVNPPSGGPIQIEAELGAASLQASTPPHPILRGVDIGSFRLSAVKAFAPTSWASVVAEGPAGPAILAGDLDGRRLVVLGFDPRESRLDGSVSFPLLVANVVDYLLGEQALGSVAAGSRLTLPVSSGAREAVLENPRGEASALPVQGGYAMTPSLDAVGRFAVIERFPSGERRERSIYVNLLDERESDTQPRPLSDQPGETIARAAVSGGQPLWTWAAALALLVLAGEWLWFRWRG
jgi:hypothetical protein